MAGTARPKLQRLAFAGLALFGFGVLAVWAGSWAYGTIPFEGVATAEQLSSTEFVNAVPDDVRQLLGEQWPTQSRALALASNCFKDIPALSELERGIERACELSKDEAGQYYSDLASLSTLCADWEYAPCGHKVFPQAEVTPFVAPGDGVAPSMYSVECESIIDFVDTLPGAYVELAGAAALPLPMLGMQTGRRENGYRFSKFGMAIRAGVSATISIEAANGDAYLDYGSFNPAMPSDRSKVLAFAQCPTQTGDWVIYAGGIWTTENSCIDVTVTSEQMVEQAVLGIRVPC